MWTAETTQVIKTMCLTCKSLEHSGMHHMFGHFPPVKCGGKEKMAGAQLGRGSAWPGPALLEIS